MKILGLILSIAVASAAQEAPDKAGAANAAYQAKEWARAQPLYAELTREQPANARFWYRLGYSSQKLGQPEKALEAFRTAKEKGAPPNIVGLNIAEVQATMGRKAEAFDTLNDLLKQGFSDPDQLASDTGLESLHADAHFTELVEQAKRNRTPCDYQPVYRQFDFWVGDWDVVRSDNGTPAGISHIERAIGNCVIWENWTSLGNAGYTGKSYNIYNPDYKRWEQFWVDSAGTMIHFFGGINDGVMDFNTADVPQANGTTLRRHLQFFNLGPDKVRQFSQGSKDEGKTWSVEYDLTYNRKK